MGRRRVFQTNRFEDGSRCSIGDHYVDNACADLDRACLKEASLFVPTITAEEVTRMVFNDDAIARLRAANGLYAYAANSYAYQLPPFARGTLHVECVDRPAASEAAFEWHADRAGPLEQATHTLNELHIKWGAVKHLLRWFNRNATPGAVRANWPSVLTLCPNAPNLRELQHAPMRYTNPQELSALLPLIRATATTVASMTMIPHAAAPRPRENVMLTLSERVVTYEGVHISLNSLTFAL